MVLIGWLGEGFAGRYGFLFGLAFIWIVIAVVCDIRKREVPNWLNFSLVAFALAYRAFFSAWADEWMFFLFGILGFMMFFALANLFYYSKMFAGGDAKLLMGLGVVLPFSSFYDFVLVGLGFVFLLFFVGAVYSLVYSLFLVKRNYSKFSREFVKNIKNNKLMLSALGLIFALMLLVFIIFGFELVFFAFGVFISLFTFILFIYAKSLDKCMIKSVKPGKLTEGDWLVGDIKLKNYIVKKTVHGLSNEDIVKLRKAGKEILIKEGIPFTPAFLIAFLIMVFFSSALMVYLAPLFYFLF